MPFDEENLDPHGECQHEITRLRAALKAFADESADIAQNYDNARLAIVMQDGSTSDTNLTVGDLRVAAIIFNHKPE